jgi:hypothetical protein
MKRFIVTLCAIAMMGLSSVSTAGAVIKPGYTWANAFGRTYELANNHWFGHAVEWPYECRGPYENVKGKTQWACFGEMDAHEHGWQVNIDPYGTATYYHQTF